MSNGHIDEAEVNALLEEEPSLLTRYLVIGMREMSAGQLSMKAEITAMREVCETRGLMCPGMRGNITDPMSPEQLRTLAAEKARGVVKTAQTVADETVHTAESTALQLVKDSRRTWAMWGVGTTLLREIMLPLVIVLATLFITGKL